MINIRHKITGRIWKPVEHQIQTQVDDQRWEQARDTIYLGIKDRITFNLRESYEK
jgi:hypothetical protein